MTWGDRSRGASGPLTGDDMNFGDIWQIAGGVIGWPLACVVVALVSGFAGLMLGRHISQWDT